MNYLQAVEESQDNSTKLKEAVKKFLEILNRTEISDSGKEFNPVSINCCCRSLLIEEISSALTDMERYSGYERTSTIN